MRCEITASSLFRTDGVRTSQQCVCIYTAVYSQTLTTISIFKYVNIVCIIQVHSSSLYHSSCHIYFGCGPILAVGLFWLWIYVIAPPAPAHCPYKTGPSAACRPALQTRIYPWTANHKQSPRQISWSSHCGEDCLGLIRCGSISFPWGLRSTSKSRPTAKIDPQPK